MVLQLLLNDANTCWNIKDDLKIMQGWMEPVGPRNRACDRRRPELHYHSIKVTNLNSNIRINHIEITLHDLWPREHMKESILHLWPKFGCSRTLTFQEPKNKTKQSKTTKNNLELQYQNNWHKNKSTWSLISLRYLTQVWLQSDLSFSRRPDE